MRTKARDWLMMEKLSREVKHRGIIALVERLKIVAGRRLMVAKSVESDGGTDACGACVHLSLREVCCWETDPVVI